MKPLYVVVKRNGLAIYSGDNYAIATAVAINEKADIRIYELKEVRPYNIKIQKNETKRNF